jgi:hypothetical protein
MNTITRGVLLGGALAIGGVGCVVGADGTAEAASETADVAALEQDSFQQVPPPPGVKFTSVAASGAGCPQNTTGESDSYHVDISPDGDAFTVEFYKFKASITPADARPESSLSCTMRVGLAVPRGYSYMVTDVVYQGEANLPAGTTANVVTAYGYQGSGIAPINITHAIKTPSTLAQFKFRDVLQGKATEAAWSNCGETQLLNVNMTLHIRNPQRKEGWLEMSYVDSEVWTGSTDPTPSSIPGLTVNVAWRRCPQSQTR